MRHIRERSNHRAWTGTRPGDSSPPAAVSRSVSRIVPSARLLLLLLGKPQVHVPRRRLALGVVLVGLVGDLVADGQVVEVAILQRGLVEEQVLVVHLPGAGPDEADAGVLQLLDVAGGAPLRQHLAPGVVVLATAAFFFRRPCHCCGHPPCHRLCRRFLVGPQTCCGCGYPSSETCAAATAVGIQSSTTARAAGAWLQRARGPPR
mmetsp:Transcript_156382/g.501683  ORF Transcript_156382/g.501683 Transcript_156382/m.501683 type:complete len:205 (-) Transcript_156382:59-673(-)